MNENFGWLMGVVAAALTLSWGLTSLIAHLLKGRLGTRYYTRYQRTVRWTRFLGGAQILIGVCWLMLLPVYEYSTGYMLVGILVTSAVACWMGVFRFHWLEHFLTRATQRREEAALENRQSLPELFYDAARRRVR